MTHSTSWPEMSGICLLGWINIFLIHPSSHHSILALALLFYLQLRNSLRRQKYFSSHMYYFQKQKVSNSWAKKTTCLKEIIIFLYGHKEYMQDLCFDYLKDHIKPVSYTYLILPLLPDSQGEERLDDVRFFDLSKVHSSPVAGLEGELLRLMPIQGRCGVFKVESNFYGCCYCFDDGVGSFLRISYGHCLPSHLILTIILQ